jgi:hypothetical protein
MLIAYLGVLSLATPDKQRDWQEGKLTDISTAPFTAGCSMIGNQ